MTCCSFFLYHTNIARPFYSLLKFAFYCYADSHFDNGAHRWTSVGGFGKYVRAQ